MKTLILTSIFSLVFFTHSYASPLVKEKTVVNYIEYCSKGQFDKIIGLYDSDLATFIAPEEIKNLWNATENNAGKFISIKEMKTTQNGKFEISNVVCQFENSTCEFAFLFDESGNLKSVVKNYCSK